MIARLPTMKYYRDTLSSLLAQKKALEKQYPHLVSPSLPRAAS